MTTRSSLFSVLLIGIIAVIIGLLVRQPARVDTSAPITPTADANEHTSAARESIPPTTSLTELHQQLREEIAARQVLQEQVEKLSARVAALDKQAADTASNEASANTPAANDDTDITPGGWFNEQALLEAGMNRAQAAELKAFYEQLEMDRLRVRDQAIREGWANSPRFGESLQDISAREDSLQDRLTEQDYDAYLYASGQNNRVEVSSVLASSPAATAGLQSGDQVLRYDNERIYDWRDLREATTEGNTNETILVEVQRGDKQLQFYVPRGPLGIRMNSISAKP